MRRKKTRKVGCLRGRREKWWNCGSRRRRTYTSEHTQARSCTQAHCRTSLHYTSEGPIPVSTRTRALLYTGTLPHVTTLYQWRTYTSEHTHARAPVHRHTAARHYIKPVKDLQSYTSEHTHARSCTQAHCRTSLQYTSEGPIPVSTHTRAFLYTGTLPHVTTVYQWRTYTSQHTHARVPVHRHIAAHNYIIVHVTVVVPIRWSSCRIRIADWLDVTRAKQLRLSGTVSLTVCCHIII